MAYRSRSNRERKSRESDNLTGFGRWYSTNGPISQFWGAWRFPAAQHLDDAVVLAMPHYQSKTLTSKGSSLHQLPDHPAIIVDLNRPAVGRVMGRIQRNSQPVINRRRHVLGVIGRLGRLFAQGVGLADSQCRADAAAGQQGDSGRGPAARSSVPTVTDVALNWQG